MAYATARGAQLAWRAAEQTQSRARLGLRVAAAGLLVCCLGTPAQGGAVPGFPKPREVSDRASRESGGTTKIGKEGLP